MTYEQQLMLKAEDTPKYLDEIAKELRCLADRLEPSLAKKLWRLIQDIEDVSDEAAEVYDYFFSFGFDDARDEEPSNAAIEESTDNAVGLGQSGNAAP